MNTTGHHPLWVGRTEKTPLSPVWVGISEKGLAALRIGGSQQDFIQSLATRHNASIYSDETITAGVTTQINEYLYGKRKHFDIPIDWSVMTAFQARTLGVVYQIPYGETRTYSQIAAQIGAPRAQRAVGRANATNPIPLVIPCHRVIGADGSLRGYGSGDGILTKAWLLDLEKMHSQ